MSDQAKGSIVARRRRKNRFVERVEYALYRMLASRIERGSDDQITRWGGRLGSVASTILRSRTHLAARNLKETFPEKSETERRRILDACWFHFGRTTLDYVRIQKMSLQEVKERCYFSDREHFDRAMAKGKGAILVSGHYGTWELAGQVLPALSDAITTVARPLDNELLERDLHHARTRTGVEYVDRRKAARALIGALSRKGVIVLLPDQAVRPREGVLVPFLGRPAWTTPAPARLSLRFGAPIVPVFSIPDGARSRLQFDAPIDPDELAPEQRNAETMTELLNDAISRRIREKPEYWLWMHDRWKGSERFPEATSGAEAAASAPDR